MPDYRPYYIAIVELLKIVASGTRAVSLDELNEKFQVPPMTGQMKLYKDVAFDITTEEMECGQWTHKLEVGSSLSALRQ